MIKTTDIEINQKKIFCIGANKTGTTSIESILSSLGYKMGDQTTGENLLKEWSVRNFEPIINFCKTAEAFQDIPFSLDFTYEAMDIAFPNSKFILTVRNDKNEWFDSLIRFHSKLRGMLLGEEKLPTTEELKMAPYNYEGFMWDAMHLTLGIDKTTLYDRKIYTDNYEQYNNKVKEYFKHRPDDLLVLNISHHNAMEKLYHFLDEEYNGESMPHLNSSKIENDKKTNVETEKSNIPISFISEKDIMKNWEGGLSKPLVSICCITYNHEKFIAEALDSFLMQKTDFPFEIIIDDDYSTDNTAVVIREYVEKFPNIISANLRKVNVGATKNAYGCFNRTQGEYLALCEGDDYWTDCNKLQYQINKMKEYPKSNISFHPVKIINSLNLTQNEFHRIANNHKYAYIDNDEVVYAKHYKDTKLIYPDFIMSRIENLLPTSSIIIKKDILKNLPSFFQNAPALDYFFQILGIADGGALYLNQVMSAYRLHPKGMSTSNMNDKKKIINFEIDMSYTLIKMDKYLYPTLHSEFRDTLSMRWDRFTTAKEFSSKELIILYSKFHPYLSLDQKKYFIRKIIDINIDYPLTATEIDAIRDTAITLETIDINISYKLMNIAHLNRPKGPFIKQKLDNYKNILSSLNTQISNIQTSLHPG